MGYRRLSFYFRFFEVRALAMFLASPRVIGTFFPQAVLAGFSFRTGEHKAFAVREIAAEPEKVPILHKNVPGNVPGNLPGNVPDPFLGKNVRIPCIFSFRLFDII